MIELIALSFSIALALSVDTFAACFAFGTDAAKSKKMIFYTPILIGVFHVIFPITSFYLACWISQSFASWGYVIGGTIFLLLAIFAVTKKKDEQCSPLQTLMSILLLAIGVSIDSFLVGISLSFSIDQIIIPALIFGVVSMSLTYLSIHLGRSLSKKLSFELNILAGLVFFILSILTFIGFI